MGEHKKCLLVTEQKDFWNGGNYIFRKAARRQKKKMLKGMILLLIAPLVIAWGVKIKRDNE